MFPGTTIESVPVLSKSPKLRADKVKFSSSVYDEFNRLCAGGICRTTYESVGEASLYFLNAATRHQMQGVADPLHKALESFVKGFNENSEFASAPNVIGKRDVSSLPSRGPFSRFRILRLHQVLRAAEARAIPLVLDLTQSIPGLHGGFNDGSVVPSINLVNNSLFLQAWKTSHGSADKIANHMQLHGNYFGSAEQLNDLAKSLEKETTGKTVTDEMADALYNALLDQEYSKGWSLPPKDKIFLRDPTKWNRENISAMTPQEGNIV